MKNSTELCENVSVSDSKNINNSEIEETTIEEVKNNSEKVSNKHSETIEKEVKTLDKNKPFKWTNEATKAAACMLKDIIDEYNKANSDLSSSLDENTDPWGFEKRDKQIKTLVDMIVNKVDLFPEEWCRFKLVSIIEKYFEEHTSSISKFFPKWGESDTSFMEYCYIGKKCSLKDYDFHLLFYIWAKLSQGNIHYECLADYVVDCFQNENEIFHDFLIGAANDLDIWKNLETVIVANQLQEYFCERESNPNEHYIEEYFDNLDSKINKLNVVPKEFQRIFLEDLFRKNITGGLPTFKDIDEIKGFKFNRVKYYNLMLFLANCAYINIDFLNLADAFISGEIDNIKGLKETYSEMFEE